MKFLVLRKRIGKLWHDSEDKWFKEVYSSRSSAKSDKWVDDDIADSTAKWPELLDYGEVVKFVKNGVNWWKVGNSKFGIEYTQSIETTL